MQTFKIFVVGPFSSGKTTFIQSISEIGVVSTERPSISHEEQATARIPALDFGRLTLRDDLVLYLFGHPASMRMDRTFEYLGQIGLPLSETGFVLVMDSAHPDIDRENAHFRQYVQDHNRPYVVALSKQDLPTARTPLQMREILNIPDDIKVLSYSWKDPKTTKQVAQELVKLFPRDELVQRVIDGLQARIDEA
jgi:uncharacterized protein